MTLYIQKAEALRQRPRFLNRCHPTTMFTSRPGTNTSFFTSLVMSHYHLALYLLYRFKRNADHDQKRSTAYLEGVVACDTADNYRKNRNYAEEERTDKVQS